MNKRQAGAFWEEAVTAYLMRSGVNILERNYRCSRGEIDIIGFHRGCLVFFEVKYRNDDRFGTALEAVGSASRKNLPLRRLVSVEASCRGGCTDPL